MAAEAGHAASRAYFAQDGSLHLNGAALFDANEVDQSSALQTALRSTAAGMRVRGGQVVASSAGSLVLATGLSGITAAVANVVSTAALTTAAGGRAAWVSVKYTTASGDLELTAYRFPTTANTQAEVSTSTADSLSWFAMGT